MELSQISLWKREFGDIYSIAVRDKEYIFRALTNIEYDLTFLDDTLSSAEVEDMIVYTALLSPKIASLDEIPNGIISPLAEQVMNVSGYGDPAFAKRVLQSKREEAQQVRGLMKAFVLATMSSYTEEDLDNYTFIKLAEKVALAEQIIQVQQAVLSGGEIKLEIIDPAEEAAKEAKRKEADRKKWDRLEKQGMAPISDESGPSLRPTLKPNDPIADRLRQAMG